MRSHLGSDTNNVVCLIWIFLALYHVLPFLWNVCVLWLHFWTKSCVWIYSVHKILPFLTNRQRPLIKMEYFFNINWTEITQIIEFGLKRLHIEAGFGHWLFYLLYNWIYKLLSQNAQHLQKSIFKILYSKTVRMKQMLITVF